MSDIIILKKIMESFTYQTDTGFPPSRNWSSTISITVEVAIDTEGTCLCIVQSLDMKKAFWAGLCFSVDSLVRFLIQTSEFVKSLYHHPVVYHHWISHFVSILSFPLKGLQIPSYTVALQCLTALQCTLERGTAVMKALLASFIFGIVTRLSLTTPPNNPLLSEFCYSLGVLQGSLSSDRFPWSCHLSNHEIKWV